MKEVLSSNGYQVKLKSDLEDDSYSLELIDTKAVEAPEKIARLLVNAGYPPKLLTVEKEDLENYFVRILNDYNGGV